MADSLYNFVDKSLYKITEGSETSSIIDPANVDSGASIGYQEMSAGSLQSANFVTGSTGWRLSADGSFEGSDGNFRGDITGATGTFTGTVSIGSLNIPDNADPTFSVDTLGNAVVKSLRRKDFHWFTIFESIDGYTKSLGGASTITLSDGMVTLTTTLNQVLEFKKSVNSGGTAYFTWDKDRSVRFGLSLATDIDNLGISVGMGDTDPGGGYQTIRFYITSNGHLYAYCSEGVGDSYVDLGANYLSAGTWYDFKIDFVAGEYAKFYVDDVLVVTITTNLPSGEQTASFLFDDNAISTTGTRSHYLSYIDFWQSV